MKKIMSVLLFVSIFTGIQNAKADEFNYYTANFSVASVSSVCPNTVPNGAHCMAIGSVVKLTAMIGCLDNLVFSDIEYKMNGSTAEISIASVVKHNKYITARCIIPTYVTKEVVIPHFATDFEVINKTIE